MYEIEFTRRAERDTRRIRNRSQQRRIVARVSKLAKNPRPAGARKLSDSKGIWRIRVGDWRVCYQIRERILLVLVVLVGRRGDVYERLMRRLG